MRWFFLLTVLDVVGSYLTAMNHHVSSSSFRRVPLQASRLSSFFGSEEPVAVATGLVPEKARHVSEDLIRKTHAFDSEVSAPLGLKLNEDDDGVYISAVVPSGGAFAAGLRSGDRVIATSATVGDAMWPKKTLAGVESALRSRLRLGFLGSSAESSITRRPDRTKPPSVKLRIQRSLENSEAALRALRTRETVVERFVLELPKPLGLTLTERAGKVYVKAVRKGGSAYDDGVVRVGDQIASVAAMGGVFSGGRADFTDCTSVDQIVDAAARGQSVKLAIQRRVDVGPWTGAFTVKKATLQRNESMKSRVEDDVGKAKAAYHDLVQSGVPGNATAALLVERACELAWTYASNQFQSQYGREAAVEALDLLFNDIKDLPAAKAKLVTNGFSEYLSLSEPERAVEFYETTFPFLAKKTNALATAAIKAYTRLGDFDRAYSVIAVDASPSDEILRSPDTILLNALLAALTKHASQPNKPSRKDQLAARCERLFDAMQRPGGAEAVLYGLRSEVDDVSFVMNDVKNKTVITDDDLDQGGALVDDVSFNVMINFYAGMRRPMLAEETLDDMVRAGYEPDKMSYTALMKAWLGYPDRAHRVFEAFRDRLEPDIAAYNTLIRSYGIRLQWREAYAVYREMLREAPHVKPNILTYTNLASGCLNANRPDVALEVLARAEEDAPDVEPNVYYYSIKIRAHGRRGDLPGAGRTFVTMRRNGLEPNAQTIAALLEACLLADDPQAGQALSKELQLRGYHVEDVVTRTLLLRCHLNAGDVDAAIALMRTMHDPGPKPQRPTMVTYNTAIEGFLQLGRPDVALASLQYFLRRYTPNELTWRALLSVPEDDDELPFLEGALTILTNRSEGVAVDLYERYLKSAIKTMRLGTRHLTTDFIDARRDNKLRLGFPSSLGHPPIDHRPGELPTPSEIVRYENKLRSFILKAELLAQQDPGVATSSSGTTTTSGHDDDNHHHHMDDDDGHLSFAEAFEEAFDESPARSSS